MAIPHRVGSLARMDSMSWDGTIYLNGDGAISSMGALLGCASGTGAPVAPSGYRFFSAWGYVGGYEGWTRTTVDNTDYPGTWLALVAEGGYQFPSSYSAAVDGGNWRGHGMSTSIFDGNVNGRIFNPLNAKEFYVSGRAGAVINSRFTSTSDPHTASATLQMRLMTAGLYENVSAQSAIAPFTSKTVTAHMNNGYTAQETLYGYFTGSAASMVRQSPEYPSVPIAIGVNSVWHSPSGKFTGYNGYQVIGGSTSIVDTVTHYNNRWTASGFAPLSAY